MSHLSRRSFLKSSAAAAAVVALSARSWSQVAGANGDVRVAVLGLNGRGKNHLTSLAGCRGARVVALCDPDTAVLERAKRSVNHEVRTYTDLRQVLESPEIDAITIATPNHWHSLAGIWACQAGKDVYVEKPVSHNVWEGRQLVNAARKHNRVVQAGTQIRSGEGLQEAVAWIRAGHLGRIKVSRGFCYKRRDSIGKVAATPPPPATVNLDLWCGPAPLAAPHRQRFHYDWHWQWPTGNGDLGNQGIHQMDVARWFLGESGLPRRSLSIGGRFGYVDDGETPNTQVILHDYATAPLIFEVRGLPAGADAAGTHADPALTGAAAASALAGTMDKYRGVSIGNIVDCEGGSLIIPNYFTAQAYDRDGKLIREFKGTDRHMQNFIDVVHSRRVADLYGPIDEGNVSSALCHLGNISYEVGRHSSPAEIREKVKADSALAEAYDRMVEHLGRNHVDLGQTPATLGLPLTVDVAAERFSGPDAAPANALLRRDYRAPYTVPEVA
jgi:predicted dehydrogenase